jgi:hypothetical protein
MGARGSFRGGEADHSPQSSTEVKNAWSYTSIPQYAFMAWCSVKSIELNYRYEESRMGIKNTHEEHMKDVGVKLS